MVIKKIKLEVKNEAGSNCSIPIVASTAPSQILEEKSLIFKIDVFGSIKLSKEKKFDFPNRCFWFNQVANFRQFF
jgi:hypothetical protein